MQMIYTLLIGLLFFTGCNGTKATANQDGERTGTTVSQQEGVKSSAINNMKNLYGKWELVKVDCCGRTTKTKVMGENDPKRIIQFNKDGTVRYMKRGDQAKMENYKAVFGKLGSQSTLTIGEYHPAIIAVNGDEMTLSWGYMDLQIETYKRLK